MDSSGLQTCIRQVPAMVLRLPTSPAAPLERCSACPVRSVGGLHVLHLPRGRRIRFLPASGGTTSCTVGPGDHLHPACSSGSAAGMHHQVRCSMPRGFILPQASPRGVLHHPSAVAPHDSQHSCMLRGIHVHTKGYYNSTNTASCLLCCLVFSQRCRPLRPRSAYWRRGPRQPFRPLLRTVPGRALQEIVV